MSAPDLVLLLGGPKPARRPTVGAAGVGAHGRRALSCTRPVAMAKAAAAPGRLWAARHIVATRRGRPHTASAHHPWPHCRRSAQRWHELAVANVGQPPLWPQGRAAAAAPIQPARGALARPVLAPSP